MILNGDECEFKVIESRPLRKEPAVFEVGGCQIKEVNKVKLLGVIIDSRIKFDDHIKNISREVNKKVDALARISPIQMEGEGYL